MVKRMLIDATHPEETRVVVVSGTRLEELDVETSTKKQLKGNIYLAKVVRVEPSLQAAFVDYGGNRHGFLAFNEIHPDYYQIPVADRQALLAEQRASSEAGADSANGDGEPGETVDVVGGDDVEDVERRRPRSTRHYKIQEVIKRRQILLVQVVKEERGNKGAALTTYLSLAGRYCVLMPNTARGGGVSRKIVSIQDRKRLKSIVSELDIPESMAVIVRTAGSERSKAEIKRDYDYLLRMWDSVRELTLKSTAAALVYEEANLIKRAIRDLYARDIDEVHVEGEDGYRAAKDFMRMLTPSHAKKVQPYRDPTMPLFYRYQVESQLDAMHSPIVQLKSGGYIVISPTEALVSIDVNSGRATKERHIEETALKTNLEAADEIARQLRLRDLAGLIVIDFIDMEESRNNHSVERRLKEAMKNDRARIQLGRISPFGLLELSRQRLRPSLLETSFQTCTHCGGTGQVRSVESTAVYVLRAIEEEGIRRRSSEVTVTVPTPVALYILNQKRTALAEIESRYEFRVLVDGDDTLIPPNYRMDRIKSERPEGRVEEAPRPIEQLAPSSAPEEEIEEDELEDQTEETSDNRVEGAGDEPQRRKRRRRKRRRRTDEAMPTAGEPIEAGEAQAVEISGPAAEALDTEAEADDAAEAAEGAETAEQLLANAERKRRRGKRGGRRRRRDADAHETPTDLTGEEGVDVLAEPSDAEAEAPSAEVAAAVDPVTAAEPEGAVPEAVEVKRKPARARRPKKAEAAAVEAAPAVVSESPVEAEAAEASEPAPKPARTRKKAAEKTEKAPAKPKTKAAAKPKTKATKAEKPASEKAEKKPAKPRKPKNAEPAAAVAQAEPEVVQADAARVLETVAAAAESADSGAASAEKVITALPEDAQPKRGWWRR